MVCVKMKLGKILFIAADLSLRVSEVAIVDIL